MVPRELSVAFNSWCERRSRVVEARGTPRRAGLVETKVAGRQRKGKQTWGSVGAPFRGGRPDFC